MSYQTFLELMGYLSSVIVLISFLMSSVVKLRVINTIGCVIFVTYAILIRSYPTAFLNVCLICVNIYYLVKLTKSDKHYSLVEGKADDGFVQYFLNYNKEDIAVYFPGVNALNEAIDAAYVTYCNGTPAGILLGKKQEDGTLKIVLDYTTAEYRDCSVGVYLYEQLPSAGVNKLVMAEPSEKHVGYLNKMGFVKEGDTYSKNLA